MTELALPFMFKLAINILSISVLCYGCYYRLNKNTDVAGSFLLFGVGIFIITNLLHGVDMSMEFAFGLFAVFTMLRYRTDAISIKEMTYLFLVTAIALLTAVSKLSTLELLALNGLICGIAFIVDTRFLRSPYRTQSISYERIENIKLHKRPQLLQDLKTRTGLNIIDIEIVHIDFLKDAAELKIKYCPETTSAVQRSENEADAISGQAS
ncbi:DUF4956 domain-containing protein [Glaciecola sp. MH2013]|uniref:DUF4956 domain-containing protein n=1 Tax=Glaciecola sp. MH2013 TaxID=2785524 RepID=UPI0018A0E35A|nr:DUF4956 domain-containing protein [Glaciecola sp. MH2013]MBF7074503.1 DUF4956 domain-containing protein [Glaciecola sp. MH2013]